MKSIANKIGTTLLIMWILGMIAVIVVGASSDGPIDGPKFINVWTFYGFVFGIPVIATAIMRWGGQK